VSGVHSVLECEASIVTCPGTTSFSMQGLPAAMEDLYENALESLIKILTEFSHCFAVHASRQLLLILLPS
jgi:hypothetical protein